MIQAGGRGQRLGGVPKGMIQVGDESVIERLLRLGARWPTFIVTNEPWPYEHLDIPLVADVIPGRGAPGGVVTALAVAQTEWVLNVACDMPWVTEQALVHLVSQASGDVDAVCFERGGRLEPLFALYRKALLPAWASRLEGHPSLHALLREVRLRTLMPADPTTLDSLNTREDLARVGARLP